MGVDLWFPLAIHHEDLSLSDGALGLLADQILRMRGQEAAAGAAWTGDVDGVDALHFDPSFDELTEAVTSGVWTYLTHLGHLTTELDLMVQRSWPVVSAPGETVAPHVHPTAHLSAVVHLTAPASGGELKFLNTAYPNELATGAGGGSAADAGPLTFGGAVYDPVPGRLLVFPAKQRHQVLPHGGTEGRVSVAYDLVVCARADRPGGLHEFIMPPPERWRRLARPVTEQGADPTGRTDLTTLSRNPTRVRHAFCDPTNHLLWSVTGHEDCMSPADATAALEVAATPTPPAPSDEHMSGLEAYRSAVDLADEALGAQGVATLGASVRQPTWIRPEPNAPFLRSPNDLVALVRVDDGDACAVEVAATDRDPAASYALTPRGFLLVGGFRATRLVGAGTVMRIGVDVPALSRPGFAEHTSSTTLTDVQAFFLATALPLTAGPPTPLEAAAAARARPTAAEDQRRHLTDAVSERLLDQGGDPASADEREILLVAACGPQGTRVGSDQVNAALVLHDEECTRLIRYARQHLSGRGRDSVDGRPEYQVDVPLRELDAVLGEAAAERLCAAGPRGLAPTSVFVRHFSPRTRPFIPFHHDTSHWTVNVPLEEPGCSDGGDLVMLLDGALQVVRRRRGWGISHPGAAVHGVRRVSRGDRWSLIAMYDPPTLDPTP